MALSVLHLVEIQKSQEIFAKQTNLVFCQAVFQKVLEVFRLRDFGRIITRESPGSHKAHFLCWNCVVQEPSFRDRLTFPFVYLYEVVVDNNGGNYFTIRVSQDIDNFFRSLSSLALNDSFAARMFTNAFTSHL